MQRLTRHSVTLGRVLVAALLLANAGYTTILSTCTMGAAECCNGTTGHRQCDMPLEPAGGQASLQDAFQCHATTVAGGLNDIQALVEKHMKQLLPVGEFIATVVCGDRAMAAYASKINSLTSSSHHVSPPPVEKYVLNETFLI